jgi:fatty acid desaturase
VFTVLSMRSTGLVAGALGTALLQLLVIPVWLLPQSAAWGWLLVPIALATLPLWSIIHESIHGTLLRDRPWNDRWGRVLAVYYGSPFVLLKAGHLLHHRYSRTPRERTEVFDPARTTRARFAPAYYARLLGGLYALEVASLILVVAPAGRWRYLARRTDSLQAVTGLLFDRVGRRDNLRRFRLDGALSLAVYGLAFWGYGTHWWMLGAALGARALIVSLADNAYHYDTKLDAPLEAMNLRLPQPLSTFMLAFNLHSVHHRHPGLRWWQLRGAFLDERDSFHAGYFSAVARQLRGPIAVTALVAPPPVAAPGRPEELRRPSLPEPQR